MPSPYFTEEHDSFRATVRRFLEKEVAPQAESWEEAAERARASRILDFFDTRAGRPFDPAIFAEDMRRVRNLELFRPIRVVIRRVPGGIRIGTPALTTRKMKEDDMVAIAAWMDEAIRSRGDSAACRRIRDEVTDLCARFPIYESTHYA